MLGLLQAQTLAAMVVDRHSLYPVVQRLLQVLVVVEAHRSQSTAQHVQHPRLATQVVVVVPGQVGPPTDQRALAVPRIKVAMDTGTIRMGTPKLQVVVVAQVVQVPRRGTTTVVRVELELKVQ